MWLWQARCIAERLLGQALTQTQRYQWRQAVLVHRIAQILQCALLQGLPSLCFQ